MPARARHMNQLCTFGELQGRSAKWRWCCRTWETSRLPKAIYAGARRAFDASLAIRRELGDTGGVAYATYWRGRLDRLEGNTTAARNWLTRALAGFHEVGDRLGIAFALNELGCLAHDEGNDTLPWPTISMHCVNERRRAISRERSTVSKASPPWPSPSINWSKG